MRMLFQLLCNVASLGFNLLVFLVRATVSLDIWLIKASFLFWDKLLDWFVMH